MIELLEGAGWPLALTCASVLVVDRLRTGRRRSRLNTALHELRRPLQALVLGGPRRSQLELAVAALADLDREINGGEPAAAMPVAVQRLAEDAVERWRAVAARAGRGIELTGSANGSRVVCRPAAIARALDNLIANALEHGIGPIRVEARVAAGRLRLRVVDGAGAGTAAVPGERIRARRRDPRRGHGLRAVAQIATEHGGRFAACRHAGGASAVIELPLADPLPPAA
jgi:signal transduction histidine kinase